jgi:hypothetical protein
MHTRDMHVNLLQYGGIFSKFSNTLPVCPGCRSRVHAPIIQYNLGAELVTRRFGFIYPANALVAVPRGCNITSKFKRLCICPTGSQERAVVDASWFLYLANAGQTALVPGYSAIVRPVQALSSLHRSWRV